MKRKLLLCGMFACLLTTLVRADEYDDLRAKWRQVLTGGTGYNPSDPDIAAAITRITNEALTHWNSMEMSPTRTYLWYDLRDLPAGQTDKDRAKHMNSSYLRLRAMALAYSTHGSPYHGNTTLLNDIKGGLDWMYDNKYNEGINWSGNLWEYVIGVPMSYNEIMVMMYDELQSTSQMTDYTLAVGKYSEDTNYTGPSTGANRVWRCTVVALCGVVTKTSAPLVLAKNDLPHASVFDWVGSSDGYYAGGSFIQHTAHPYNGGYGVVTLYFGAELLNLLNGSTWEVPNSSVANIFEWVYRAYEPLIYKGMMFDSVMGRNAAAYDTNRDQPNSDHLATHKISAAIIRLSQFADPADAAAFKSMVKHWIVADTSPWNFFVDASVEMTILAKAIVNDSSIPNRGELSLYKQYPRMDRVAFHRPGFAFNVSMFSSRIYNYESINGSNLRGWHTGSGMTYLYNNDFAQYSGNFWATVDSHRMPGTTVLKDLDVDHRKYNGEHYQGNALQHWVGGASLSDLIGVSGMRYKQPNETLLARKSWFMFDDEIVALGSDITSTDNEIVETIIENRKLNSAGNNAVTVNETAQFTSGLEPVDVTLNGVNWAHLAGNVSAPTLATISPRPRRSRAGAKPELTNGRTPTTAPRSPIRT